MFGLALQNLFDQIVQHETVAAGESLDKTGFVCSPLHRECSHLQTGDPAFGASFQRGDLFRREVEAHHLVEESRGLRVREAQIPGPQFGQLAVDA